MKWRHAFYEEELAICEEIGLDYEIHEQERLPIEEIDPKAMIRERVLYVIAPPEDEVAVIHLIGRDARYCIVHRCAKGIKGWQVTWFDEIGPYGDTVRDTLQKALDVARAAPTSPVAPDARLYEMFMLNEVR